MSRSIHHRTNITYCAVSAGITRVFFGSDFVTVTKSEDVSWDLLKPEIFAAIMEFYSSAKLLFMDSATSASTDTAIHEDVSEIVEQEFDIENEE
ncbi:putative scaffold protein Nfu/NifU [Helianthus anomalus]